MIVDEPREGDQPFEHEGENLLHISGVVSVAYDGSVLDLEETRPGARSLCSWTRPGLNPTFETGRCARPGFRSEPRGGTFP